MELRTFFPKLLGDLSIFQKPKPPCLQKSTNFYYNLGYWFLSLIVLVIAGFYTSYFSILLRPQPSIIHIHFTLMALWVMMLITQPFLIKFKKVYWHRLVGKISYVLVPLVLISSFLMIRFSYYRFISDLKQKIQNGSSTLTNSELLKEAAKFQALTFYYLLAFVIFYSLAVINRKKSFVHSRYMLATALVLLGPTVDRILFFVFHLKELPGGIPLESLAFFIADLILLLLLWKDYKNKRPTKTLLICLCISLVGQILNFTVPSTNAWTQLVSFLMRPAP